MTINRIDQILKKLQPDFFAGKKESEIREEMYELFRMPWPKDFAGTENHQEDATRDALHHIKTKYERQMDKINRRMLTADMSRHSEDVFREYNKLQIHMINFERRELKSLRRKNQYGDEVLRKVEYELDLEEATLKNAG